MSVPNAELTCEKIYNQPWACTVIVGYGAGIYIGTGPEAKFIAKAAINEIGLEELMALYTLICIRHNQVIKDEPYKRRFNIFVWLKKQGWGKKKFVYPELPAE